MVTEGAGFVGGLALEIDGEPREQERQGVGGVVTGVGDERETVGADAGGNSKTTNAEVAMSDQTRTRPEAAP